MKKVYSIPFGTDFLVRLNELILRDCRNLQDVAVVFAGKRPALYLKKLLGATFTTPGYPPRCFSIEEFIDYIVRKRFPFFRDLDIPDALWLLYQSLQSIPASARHPFRQKSFGEFFYWGKHLLDFINQLDAEDIHSSKLNLLEENASIGYDVPVSINELLGHVSVLRDSFHALLTREAAFTRGYKHLTASRMIGELPVDEFEKIYFAGLFALPNTEKKILKHLWEQKKAEIVFEGTPSDWPVMQSFVTSLGAEVEPVGNCVSSAPPSIKIYSGFDTHSEVLKVHAILKKNNPGKTAVVLPLSDTLFPLLTFAADRVKIPCNVSIGYPLERTPVFDLVTHIIGAQAARRVDNAYHVDAYLKVLLHPFVKNIEADKGVRQAILDIEKHCIGNHGEGTMANRSMIRPEEIEEAMIRFTVRGEESGERSYGDDVLTILHEIHRHFFSHFEKAGTLCEYAEALQDAMEFLLDHTAIRSYALSGEIFSTLLRTLENMKNVAFSRATLHEDNEENRRLLCDFVIRLLQPVNLPFETKPIELLEIIGLLESRNIAFDTVIILDANEGVLPQQKKVDPLIPVGVHEMLGIPTPRQNEEIFRYYFERLVASSKEAHILYIDGEDKQRSRYIEKVIWEKEKAQKRLDVIAVDQSVYPINLRPRKTTPCIEKTALIMDLLHSRTLSPSSIDHYLFCPLFFYYRDLLNLEEKEAAGDDIDAAERGTLIHSILQDTFEGYLNREIIPSMHQEIAGRLQKSIDARLKGASGNGDYYLFKRLVSFKLEAFLRKDLKAAPVPFCIAHLEERFTYPIDIDGAIVNLTGKVDRIDYAPSSGQYMVIDYKTGTSAPYRKRIPSGIALGPLEEIRNHIRSFQLPVYIYLFCKDRGIGVGAVNAKLILLKNNSEEVFFRDDSPEKKVELYGTYLGSLCVALRHILDPERPFKPFDDKACSGCVFSHMCHV